MDYYGRSNNKSYPTHNPKWPLASQEGSGEAKSGLVGCGTETYPERSGERNCIYYMRTGVCGFGDKCNFNHPKDLTSFVGVVSIGRGEYPQRVGEQECKFYLRTGTCHFGMNCRFHHPRNLLIDVPLNVYGYPLRLGEKECSYYMQTGLCKFGMACKFHHPQPAGISTAPVVYLVQSPSTHLPSPFSGVFANYKLPRPPPLVNSYVHGANGAVLHHAAVVSLANWNAYQGVLNPPLYPGAKPLAETMAMNVALPSPPASRTSYLPVASYGSFGSYLKQQKLPERMYCFLSPLGLPLRPGVQPCKFYLQNGSCKYGHDCKFDHPVGAMQDSPSSKTAGCPMPELNLYRGRLNRISD